MTRLLIPIALLAVGATVAVSALGGQKPDPDPGATRPAADTSPDRGDAAVAGLHVTARPEAGTTGRVAFALFADKRAFDKKGEPLRKAFVDIADGRAVWSLADLPAGMYAVKAFHDANGNGELDKGTFGIPTEAYGFSRNARGRMGPPAYEDARFSYAGKGLDLEIRLQ